MREFRFLSLRTFARDKNSPFFVQNSEILEFRRIKLSLLLHNTKVRARSNESHKGRGQNSVSVESWMISDKKHTDLTSTFSLVLCACEA